MPGLWSMDVKKIICYYLLKLGITLFFIEFTLDILLDTILSLKITQIYYHIKNYYDIDMFCGILQAIL